MRTTSVAATCYTLLVVAAPALAAPLGSVSLILQRPLLRLTSSFSMPSGAIPHQGQSVKDQSLHQPVKPSLQTDIRRPHSFDNSLLPSVLARRSNLKDVAIGDPKKTHDMHRGIGQARELGLDPRTYEEDLEARALEDDLFIREFLAERDDAPKDAAPAKPAADPSATPKPAAAPTTKAAKGSKPAAAGKSSGSGALGHIMGNIGNAALHSLPNLINAASTLGSTYMLTHPAAPQDTQPAAAAAKREWDEDVFAREVVEEYIRRYATFRVRVQ